MRNDKASGLILNEETLSKLDLMNEKALYNSVDVGDKGLRSIS